MRTGLKHHFRRSPWMSASPILQSHCNRAGLSGLICLNACNAVAGSCLRGRRGIAWFPCEPQSLASMQRRMQIPSCALPQAVAVGDLSSNIAVNSKDEMGQLLGALRRMQQSLVETVTVVRTNAQSVASASAQIAVGNHDLSKSRSARWRRRQRPCSN